MPRITVIMPSLNVAKYIKPCMDSVLGQSLSDLEILAIDAGSDDGTLEILEDYAASDRRVKVLHSDRRSYGYQLNMGIAMAQGEYIGIVETDDMILPKAYEALYHKAVETDAEYVKGQALYFMELPNGAEWEQPTGMQLPDTGMLGKVIAPRNMPELLNRDIYLWTGIYKKEFVSKIHLNETPGAAFQDQGFLFQTISSADRAVYLNEVVYRYRQDNENSSIMNQNGFHYLVEEYSYIENFLPDKTKEWKNIYYQRMWNQCLGRFRTMAAFGVFWDNALPDMEIIQSRLKRAEKDGLLFFSDMESGKKQLLQIFYKGARDLYLYYTDEFEQKAKQAADIVQQTAGHPVIIFGCGRIGRYAHALFERKQPNLAIAFCDNNPCFWNTELQKIPVLKPQETLDRYPEAVYVVANSANGEEIRQQLISSGIMRERIYTFAIEINILVLQHERVREKRNAQI